MLVIAPPTGPLSPGDILFYAAAKQDPFDAAIASWEEGVYVHAAIAISSQQKIEALVTGVVVRPIDPSTIAAWWQFPPIYNPYTNNALAWLQSQVGQPYGWGDIAEAVLSKFEHGLAFDEAHRDCSDLALSFLQRAGVRPDVLGGLDPHTITPQELSRTLATV